jgi:hypothetical protein
MSKIEQINLADYVVVGKVSPPTKVFVNGFDSWMETHHEVVSEIARILNIDAGTGLAHERYESQGTGGMYELGEELTDEFEKLHEGREWDGEFFDEIEAFLNSKNL